MGDMIGELSTLYMEYHILAYVYHWEDTCIRECPHFRRNIYMKNIMEQKKAEKEAMEKK